tara:strand:+ start:402 stop:539 length:138 start_codon:yes stop_codon:yes gene_type:complete
MYYGRRARRIGGITIATTINNYSPTNIVRRIVASGICNSRTSTTL